MSRGQAPDPSSRPTVISPRGQRLFPKLRGWKLASQAAVLQAVPGPVLSSGPRLWLLCGHAEPGRAQDPKGQQDGGCEAHAGEILHRVVWGEGAGQPAPSSGTEEWAQGCRLPGRDVAPSPGP